MALVQVPAGHEQLGPVSRNRNLNVSMVGSYYPYFLQSYSDDDSFFC